MNGHFATRSLNEDGTWKDLKIIKSKIKFFFIVCVFSFRCLFSEQRRRFFKDIITIIHTFILIKLSLTQYFTRNILFCFVIEK